MDSQLAAFTQLSPALQAHLQQWSEAAIEARLGNYSPLDLMGERMRDRLIRLEHLILEARADVRVGHPSIGAIIERFARLLEET